VQYGEKRFSVTRARANTRSRVARAMNAPYVAPVMGLTIRIATDPAFHSNFDLGLAGLESATSLRATRADSFDGVVRLTPSEVARVVRDSFEPGSK
jgi:hypothetical protein